MYITIPTIDSLTKEHGIREFETKEEYLEFVLSHFKHPGSYGLKETKAWREAAIEFETKKYYCKYIKGSRDFIKFWDYEKLKSSFMGGVIYHYTIEEDDKLITREYFVPGLFYFYLNYCRIFDKIRNMEIFPDLWDSDLHFFLYVLIAKLKGKHSLVLKKRQAGYTFKHGAILINNTWFGQRQTNKIFANAKEHVENAWKFIDLYRNHLNTHTGWYRNFAPDSTLNWQCRIQFTQGSKKVWKGNQSILRGITTEKDAAKGVGGANSVVYGEESGMNDTLHITHEYILPAVQIGNITTGLIMYSGSVGELQKCEPLKNFFFSPENNNFLGVDNVWDEDQASKTCGFFVPEFWNYPGCMDADGNSDIDKALRIIGEEREQESKKNPESYRLYCSQHPLSPKEAFAVRAESIFPQAIIDRQARKIEQEKSFGIPTELYYDVDGRIKDKLSTKLPITEFPVKKQNKEGVIQVWERPIENAPFGTYFGAVDPIIEGKTESSASLFCVYIYKNLIEIKREVDGVIQTVLEGDKIVAVWTGRYDDVNKTNDIAEILIEWYNAWTIVENNVTSFIQHMIRKKKQKFLAKKTDLPFLQEIQANRSVFQEYGVRTTETVKTYIFSNMIEYLKEELGVVMKENGEVVKINYGVERIPDIMLLKEMLAYHDKLNVDRIITFGLVVTFAKSRQVNGQIMRKDERTNKKEDLSLYKVQKSPFSNRFLQGYSDNSMGHRNPFKNIR